ncbi:MAG: aminotransferase class III-fold pyridoxal phosphate-dependent enzyme [Trueperaceae bacterium]
MATVANPLFYQTRDALPTVQHAEGVWLTDEDGERWLDGCSGAITVNVGHGHPKVLAALEDQARRVTFAYRTQFENRPAIDLANALVAQLSAGLDRIFFVSGGSEAIETSYKLARSYHAARGDTDRYRIVSRFPSYHGSTLGALATTGYRPLTEGYAPMMVEPNHVSAPFCYRCPFGLTYPSCGLACAEDFERAVQALDPSTVAAFVIEPIGGASTGAIVPPPGYFEVVHRVACEHGILVIYDEVMTGAGRTGAFCAYQHWEGEAVPDVLALSKGLGSGYAPLGAVACRDRVAETVLDAGSFPHGFTYAGNPLACAVGLAVLNVLEEENLIERAARVGSELGWRLQELATRHPTIGDVRGMGMLWGLEFVHDRATRAPFDLDRNVAQRVTLAAARERLLVYPRRGGGGLSGDHVLIAPPLTIEESEIDQLIQRLDRALAAVEGDLTGAAA